MVKPCSLLLPETAKKMLPRLFLSNFYLWVGLLFFSAASHAVVETFEFDSDATRLRYQTFIDELRCPKCQNQNLSGSDSAIASDLRRELFRLLDEGRSDEEIVDFMVSRYGDYILYKPRVTRSTYLLWYGPAAMLLLGLVVLVFIVRRRGLSQKSKDSVVAEVLLSAEEQARLDALLLKSQNDSDGDSK